MNWIGPLKHISSLLDIASICADSKTIVPSYGSYEEIPGWTRGGEKINRTDLRGDRKVQISHYCDQVCFAKAEGTWEE